MNIPLVILLLEGFHVFRDVTTENVLLQDLIIELLGLGIVAREALLVMGDEDTTVGGTLEGTEHTRTSRRAFETNVEVALEGTRGILLVKRLGHGKSTVRVGDTLVLVCEAELSESTARAEEASRICCTLPVRHASNARPVKPFNIPAVQLVRPWLIP